MLCQQLAAHKGNVIGAGNVARRRQTGGVGKMGIVHTQPPGAVVHLLHEQLRHAGDLLRQCHRRVVAGGYAHAFQQLLHGDLLALRQKDLAAAHAGGVGRHRHHIVIGQRAAVDGVHGQQQRHDLGDAGRLQLLMLVLGEQHLSRGLFHQHRGAGGQRQVHRPGVYRQHSGDAQRRQQRCQFSFHSVPSRLFSMGMRRDKTFMPFRHNFRLQNRRRYATITR